MNLLVVDFDYFFPVIEGCDPTQPNSRMWMLYDWDIPR